MNNLSILRKIRKCTSETPALMLLERLILERVQEERQEWIDGKNDEEVIRVIDRMPKKAPRLTRQRARAKKPWASQMTGNIAELRVAADLIAREYWVFHAAVGYTPCDFIALKGTEFIRIEVRTAHKQKNGKPLYPKPDKEAFDMLALYFPEDGSIEYIPVSEV